MRPLKALLIFRPLNLLILVATQVAVYYFLTPVRVVADLQNPVFVKLLLAGILLAMAGNTHNDLADVREDQYNKPGRNYSVYWPSRIALWLVYGLLVLMSISMAALISMRLGLIFVTLHVLLFLYNFQLKRLPLIGNFTISALAGFAVIVVGLIFSEVENGPLFFYAAFAFLMTLIREIVKDAQDTAGDRKAGSATLPLLIGKRRTNTVISGLTMFTLVLFISLGYNGLQVWFSGGFATLVSLYGAACVVLPLSYVIVRTAARQDADYNELSMVLKYVMVTGLASMLFF